MASPAVDRVFLSESFVRDLKEAAGVPLPALDAIVASLGAITTDDTDIVDEDEIARIARSTGADPGGIRKAFLVLQFFGSLVATNPSSASDLARRVEERLKEQKIDATAFVTKVRSLPDAVGPLRTTYLRRQAIEVGGKTVGGFAITCDLRAITPPWPESTEELAKFDPKIAGLVPLAMLRITFADDDDGDDCVFQLTAPDLRRLVIQLQAASRQLDLLDSKVKDLL